MSALRINKWRTDSGQVADEADKYRTNGGQVAEFARCESKSDKYQIPYLGQSA